jgi:hypothetical protein
VFRQLLADTSLGIMCRCRSSAPSLGSSAWPSTYSQRSTDSINFCSSASIFILGVPTEVLLRRLPTELIIVCLLGTHWIDFSVPKNVPKRGPKSVIRQPTPTMKPIKTGLKSSISGPFWKFRQP